MDGDRLPWEIRQPPPDLKFSTEDGEKLWGIQLDKLHVENAGLEPKVVAVQEALRSDLALYAGGLSWIDGEYDERLGEVLRRETCPRKWLGVEPFMRFFCVRRASRISKEFRHFGSKSTMAKYG